MIHSINRQFQHIVILVFLVLICLPAKSFATSFFVTVTKGSSSSTEEKEAIRDLISTHLEDGENRSLSPSRSSADYIIKSKVVKLGSAYVVSLYKYKGKKRIYKSKLKAAQFEEMDVVVQRLVRSVIRQVSVKKTIQVGQVTKEEQVELRNRRQALSRWQISMGPAWTENLNASRPGINWGLGYTYSVQTKWDLNILTHILTSVESATDASFYDLSIGANFYFTAGDSAPYIGGQFGYAGGAAHENNSDKDTDPLAELFGKHISDDDASGLLASVVLGYGFFRASTVSAGIEFRYAKLFSETKKSKKQPGLSSLSILIQY